MEKGSDKKKTSSVRKVGREIYRLILFAFVLAGGATALFATAELVIGTIGYLRTRRVYDDANRRFVSVHAISRNNTEPAPVSENTVSKNTVSENDTDEIDVDIKALREENKEVIGWIYFEDGLISYPVLYSGDNEKYLKRNYKEKYLAAGSIFMDKDGSSDFSDHYTLLYGHNMRDLTMFGKLRYYKTKKDYIKGHEYFRIITENNEYRYRIFSCRTVNSDGPVFSAIDKDSKGLAEFATKNLLPGSTIETDVKISDNDNVLALSTCVNDYKYRLIVCGVRVSEKKRGEGKDEVLPEKPKKDATQQKPQNTEEPAEEPEQETPDEEEQPGVSVNQTDPPVDLTTVVPTDGTAGIPDSTTLTPATPAATTPATTTPAPATTPTPATPDQGTSDTATIVDISP